MAFLSNIGKSGDVAERSPGVISANLKEDMLLQKKMVVLGRSERSVVHQITVDQKVLYKRFQARLIRSKLAHARLLGQRDLQRDLRAKNLGGLNTDIAGNSDEDYMFLKMLQQRPCTASSFSPSLTDTKKQIPVKTKKCVSNDDNNTDQVDEELKKNGRSASAKARCYRHVTSDATSDKKEIVGRTVNVADADETKLKLRPATSTGTRVDEEFTKHQQQLESADMVNSRPKTSNQVDKAKPEKLAISETTKTQPEAIEIVDKDITSEDGVATADEASKESKETTPRKNVDTEDADLDRELVVDKKQTVAFLEDLKLDVSGEMNIDQLNSGINSTPSTPISPGLLSRRASRGADFFQEEKKVDLVSLRLKQAKSMDFSDDVQKFCEEIEEMNENNPSVDYYSIRLQISRDQAIDKPLAKVPGTPEDENKRSVGNLFIRSLTVPEINWNFTGDK